MSKDAIRAQIDSMPAGPQKRLAEFMNAVYEGEYDDGWPAIEPTYDLLDAPLWEPPSAGVTTFSSGDSITEVQHNTLAAIRENARGWFYLRDGKLVFVTIDEWRKVKAGEREP